MIVLPGEPDNVEDFGFHPIRLNREKEKKKKSVTVVIYLYSLTTTDQKIKSDMMTQ